MQVGNDRNSIRSASICFFFQVRLVRHDQFWDRSFSVVMWCWVGFIVSGSGHAWIGYLPGQENNDLGQVRVKFRSVVNGLLWYNWVVPYLVTGRLEYGIGHETCAVQLQICIII